jgi:hypothetical protein
MVGLLIVGCNRMGAKPAAEKPPAMRGTLTAPEVEQQMEELKKKDPVLSSQADVELSVRWLVPGTAQVTIMNKTQKQLKITPENFKIYFPPNKALISPLPTSVKSFPILNLNPGEQASGQLMFPKAPPERACRLAFSHAACQPAMANFEK